MFNSITGIVTAKNPKLLYLENNGIEWEINVPDSNLEMIGSVGSETKIYTWLLHTDVLMSLYGFSSVQERSVVLDLLKVDGVGPKGALKIMSSVSSSRLMEVLEKGDLKAFGKLMIASHESLRDLYEVSCDELDTLVDSALKLDCVLGSRMTGAGFGGCTVSLVKEDGVDEFIEKVGAEYLEKVVYAASFYITEIGDGGREIKNPF